MASSELDAIVARQKEIKQETVRLGEESGVLWTRFDEIADDAAGFSSFKHVSLEAEWTCHRIISRPGPRINIARLEELCTEEQWKEATRQARVFDQARLAAAVAKGIIPADLVAQATEQPGPGVSHRSDRASENDLAAVRRGTS